MPPCAAASACGPVHGMQLARAGETSGEIGFDDPRHLLEAGLGFDALQHAGDLGTDNIRRRIRMVGQGGGVVTEETMKPARPKHREHARELATGLKVHPSSRLRSDHRGVRQDVNRPQPMIEHPARRSRKERQPRLEHRQDGAPRRLARMLVQVAAHELAQSR